MTAALDVITIAAVTQLAVLPGEKVQFVIAGLSTRYDPKVVVAAAGSAFAGWTALEVAFGAALRSALPPAALDAFTGVLFAVFAVLLVRSAPERGAAGGDGSDADSASVEADGGFEHLPGVPDRFALGGDPSGRFGSFLPIFAMMAAGEFGDKTQLVTIGLAAQYGARPEIWVGEMLVIIPVSLANASFFHRFSGRFDARRTHLAGAALFGFFALDTALSLLVGVSIWETAVEGLSNAVLSLG